MSMDRMVIRGAAALPDRVLDVAAMFRRLARWWTGLYREPPRSRLPYL